MLTKNGIYNELLTSSPGFLLVLRQRKISRCLSTSGKPGDEADELYNHQLNNCCVTITKVAVVIYILN